MGTPHRIAAEVYLSPQGTEPLGSRGAAEFERTRGSVQVKDRTRCDDCADLPAGATSQIAKAAGSGAGCGASGGWRAAANSGEVGGWTTGLTSEIWKW